MTLAFLAPIWGFLKSMPREIWYGIAAVLLLFLAYQHGVSSENERWVAEVARIRAERDNAMIAATEADKEIAALRGQEIEQRRKELDDATANMPDRQLTDRQRARVCAERLRQGRRCETPTATTP